MRRLLILIVLVLLLCLERGAYSKTEKSAVLLYKEPGYTGEWLKKEDVEGKVLLAAYQGYLVYSISNHSGLINYLSNISNNCVKFTYLDKMWASNLINGRGGYVLVADFYVSKEDKGEWQFAVDSNDASEIEVDGTVVAAYYGNHPPCNCTSHNGSIYLSSGWHRAIARLHDWLYGNTIRVYYKKPGSTSWSVFSNTEKITSPKVNNAEQLETPDFVKYGNPAD